jgi:hypothetical protein
MRRTRLLQSTRLIAGLLSVLLLAILAVPLGAQSAPKTRPFYYDVSKEITLSGTVTDVLARPSAGMIMGSHLMLETSSGTLDASLGRFGLQGKGALSVAAGEQVEVTGVMKTIKDRQVFLTRTVKAGGQVYTLRNAHGVQMSAHSRERASQQAAQKGESL